MKEKITTFIILTLILKLTSCSTVQTIGGLYNVATSKKCAVEGCLRVPDALDDYCEYHNSQLYKESKKKKDKQDQETKELKERREALRKYKEQKMLEGLSYEEQAVAERRKLIEESNFIKR